MLIIASNGIEVIDNTLEAQDRISAMELSEERYQRHMYKTSEHERKILKKMFHKITEKWRCIK